MNNDIANILQSLLCGKMQKICIPSLNGAFEDWSAMYQAYDKAIIAELMQMICNQHVCIDHNDKTTQHYMLYRIDDGASDEILTLAFSTASTQKPYCVITQDSCVMRQRLHKNARCIGTLVPFMQLHGIFKRASPLQFPCLLGIYTHDKHLKNTSLCQSVTRFHGLNVSQNMCMQGIIKPVTTPRIDVIDGPPGTGKTRVLIHIIETLRCRSDSPILVTSECNDTVRHLFTTFRHHSSDASTIVLGNPMRVCSELHPWLFRDKTNQLTSLLNRLRRFESVSSAQQRQIMTELQQYRWLDWFTAILREKSNHAPTDLDHALAMMPSGICPSTDSTTHITESFPESFSKSNMRSWAISHADVIFCTLCTAGQSWIRGLGIKTIIVDEAAHSTVPMLLNALTIHANHLIVAGDEKQANPMVLSKTAIDAGLRNSLLQRLSYYEMNPCDECQWFSLTTQYRMHPEIAHFPLRHVYHKKVTTEYSDQTIGCPYHVIDAMGREQRVGFSYSNKAEVNQTLRWLQQQQLHPSLSVAIVTPYAGQIKCFKSAFKRCMLPQYPLYTIQSIQGQEADIVILSLVRTRGVGFLDDFRLINVALTRARKRFMIIGCRAALKRIPILNKLFVDAETRGLLSIIPPKLRKKPRKHQIKNN